MKSFKELSDDINNIEEIDIEKIKNGEVIIDEIIDVITEKDIDKLSMYTEANIITMNAQIESELKRGEMIYVVCLLRKKGTTSFSSPSTQSVVACRIVDIYSGLSYLNKIK